ncbi:MAG: thioesterase family protein [Bacteroidales bacterium]|nr:thioesterase family protein [Bacteroidales bacterium]
MYPYLRITKMLLTRRYRPELRVADTGVLRLRVWPGDIDIFGEMNNGRHLTMMDFGRFDLAARSGLLKDARKKSWGFAVAGASVRFRHRLKLFQKYELHSEVVGYDEKWIYFHQQTIRRGRIHSAALVRAAITSKDGIVNPEEVWKTLGHKGDLPCLPHWVKAWAEADELRPWQEETGT